MGFVKVVKSNAYYKRYQVQFRRRRQQKTDYYARKRLIWTDKNKYAAPKYRFVVRFSNRDVVCAIIASDAKGDRVVQSAYGHELAKYGLKFGFNNYASTYATGLLLARRLNAKFHLPFLGNKEAPTQYFNVSEGGDLADESGKSAEDRRPFKAVLDAGLYRTTTGSRIFAAVKGACDGGLNVPHSTRRFPGTPKEKGAETDFEIVAKYIYGGNVADYMNQLAEEDEDKYKSQFSVASKNKISGKDVEGIYKSIHAKIRAEPIAALKTKTADLTKLGYFKTRKSPKDAKAVAVKKFFKPKKLTVQERKAKIKAVISDRDTKLAAIRAKLEAARAAAEAEDEEEEEVAAAGSGSDSDSD